MKVLPAALLVFASAAAGAAFVLLWDRYGPDLLDARRPLERYEARPAGPSPAETAREDVEDVSLVAVVADPAKFHGRRISVIGYLNLDFEGNALYVDKEAFDQLITENAIWVSVDGDFVRREAPKLSGRYVAIEGTFDAEVKGHLGMFAGSLRDIDSILLWPSRRDLDRTSPRPKAVPLSLPTAAPG